ncbi:alpha/beta-hydrolase [Aspergillus sclerotiicarbonarius CBS 121057]|uniref:Alpha/beta-hydrolase n=1 Tax=Aspergillus sclerotiicarbonarius (strain CBS 121057 / IBT 28362) TaxID=1448318 RepID=A0A319EL32_ASPSB|nr:alpha/beta-hydrolase [Aspergillus sclerotiicarbonarius CBS 121057]
MGSVHDEDIPCRRMCKETQTKVISIGYRLAPKHPYPTGLNDCVHATLWALNHFSIPSVVISGTSAGATNAFGVALKLIDAGLGHKVKGVVALVPIVVHPDAVPVDKKPQSTSYIENANYSINTTAAMRCFYDVYGAPPEDRYVSGLLHPRLGELRKVYIVECGMDTVRDDARLMKGRLEELGVALRYDAYPGFPHGFWSFPSERLRVDAERCYGNWHRAVTWVHRE